MIHGIKPSPSLPLLLRSVSLARRQSPPLTFPNVKLAPSPKSGKQHVLLATNSVPSVLTTDTGGNGGSGGRKNNSTVTGDPNRKGPPEWLKIALLCGALVICGWAYFFCTKGQEGQLKRVKLCLDLLNSIAKMLATISKFL